MEDDKAKEKEKEEENNNHHHHQDENGFLSNTLENSSRHCSSLYSDEEEDEDAQLLNTGDFDERYDGQYHLRCIVYHTGSSDSGHYIADVLHGQQWKNFNDSHVDLVCIYLFNITYLIKLYH